MLCWLTFSWLFNRSTAGLLKSLMFLCPCFSTSYRDSSRVHSTAAKNDKIYQEPPCSSSQECMLSPQKHKAVEENRNQPHRRRCCVSYLHCYGNAIVENVASCAHVESHVSHTSVLCKHPTGLPRGVVMERGYGTTRNIGSNSHS